MKRKIIALAAPAILVALPLMGAKSCGTGSGEQPASTGDGIVFLHQQHPVGKVFTLGGHTWWIGEVPPEPAPGTQWAPHGHTKLGRPIWVEVPG